MLSMKFERVNQSYGTLIVHHGTACSKVLSYDSLKESTNHCLMH